MHQLHGIRAEAGSRTDLKLAVYAIAKNERKNTDAWYQSASEADAVVVLDTGSTDGTPERLAELGATVFRDYTEPFRFDRALNQALNHVPENIDICFVIDLDEWYEEPGWAEAVKDAWRRTPGCNQLKYRFAMERRKNAAGETIEGGVFWRDRIHSRHGWYHSSPVHVVVNPEPGTIPRTGKVPEAITLVHHQQQRPERRERITLHLLGVQEEPNNPRRRLYLGREYYYRREWPQAIETLEKYLELIPEKCWHDEKGSALYYLATAYLENGQPKEAELAALRGVAESEGREPLLFLTEIYYFQGRLHEARYYAETALRRQNNNAYCRDDRAYTGAVLYDFLAMIYWKQGDRAKAIEAGRKCVEIEPNKKRFRENLKFFTGEKKTA